MPHQEFTREELNIAFKKLKRFVYYDKSDLALRRQLAIFEASSDFDSDLDDLLEVVNDDDLASNDLFVGWLEEIQCRVAPKKIASPPHFENSTKMGTFLTNRTSSSQYHIESVNYFFDGPIQFHLIAVLWVMREGKYLDSVLGEECYGARVEPIVRSRFDSSGKLYQRYHGLYKRWRDTGIAKAKHLISEEGKSVCIFGLDVKEYYYHISIDYDEVAQEIAKVAQDLENEPSELLRALEAVARKYKRRISQLLSITNESVPRESVGLPIGLLSSQLLANWYLHKLDVAIESELRPFYYGRYVDDILIVMQAPATLREDNPIDDLVEKLFVKSKILVNHEDGKYGIAVRPGLFLQREKCILQYFDADHSVAGLDKFHKALEANGSDLLLMPVDEEDSPLESVAYDLLYDGSINKFRSVKGIAENRYGLAKYLGRQSMLHLLTDGPINRESNASVINFFRGRSVIEYHDLWERVFALLFISGDDNGFQAFITNIRLEIERIRCSDVRIQKKVRVNLLKHLELSISMVLALGKSDGHTVNAARFRRTNLMRHHFVRMPLVNFTNYKGSLISRDLPCDLRLLKTKLKASPRFVNFDECMLLVMSGKLCADEEGDTQLEDFLRAGRIFEQINDCVASGVYWDVGSERDSDE